MGSQESPRNQEAEIQNLLADAPKWTEYEKAKKLKTSLKIIKDSLCRYPAEEGVNLAKSILQSFLPQIEVNRDTLSLLRATLPALKTFFDELLQKCEADRDNDIALVGKSLKGCCTVAECCELAVKCLLQSSNLDVQDVDGLPQAVLHVVTGSLDYCKTSGDKYSNSNIEVIRNILSTLFRQAVDLSTHFTILLPKITFSGDDEDVEILLKVMEDMVMTASILSELSEVRACVTVWRAYASLIQQYSILISCMDFTLPMNALVKEIRSGLGLLAALPVNDSTVTEKDFKVVQRITKMAGFCLKIIVALCDKFRGLLRGAHPTLVSLLLVLFRFAPHNMAFQEYPTKMKDEVQQQATIAIDPLLLHLREDEEFFRAVLEFSGEEEVEQFEFHGSYLLLLTAVSSHSSLKKTSKLKMYLSKVFETTGKSHAALSLPCLMDGVMCGGKPQRKVALYEHVLTRMSVLAATLGPDAFHLLEDCLIQWLLSGQSWPSLLAADVWCFVARYGTSELCLSHCSLLLKLLPHTPMYSNQRLMITSLVTRLVPKLTNQHSQAFFSFCSDTGNEGTIAVQTLCYLLQARREKGDISLLKDILRSSTQAIQAVLTGTSTEYNILKLVEELEYVKLIISAANIREDDEISLIRDFTDALLRLWARIPVEYRSCTSVRLLVCGLIQAACAVLPHISGIQLYQIISLCVEWCKQESPAVSVAACELITAYGKNQVPASSSPECEHILNSISEGLSLLLKSSSPLVYQSALDTFVMYGQHTLHENVLPSCLKLCDATLQERVTKYLQQEPHALPSGESRRSLLCFQNIDTEITANTHKDFIRIADIEDSKANDPVKTNYKEEEERGTKRKREELEDTQESCSTVGELLDLLNSSQCIIQKLVDKVVDLKDTDRQNVTDRLQKMLCMWSARN